MRQCTSGGWSPQPRQPAGNLHPPQEQRDWRDLTCYRTKLEQERVRAGNRVQGVLERANIKPASIISDMTVAAITLSILTETGFRHDFEVLTLIC